MCRRMVDRQLQTYVRIMRVPVKSISVLHGQRQTLTTLTIRASIHIHFRISQPYCKIFHHLNNNSKNHPESQMVRNILVLSGPAGPN